MFYVTVSGILLIFLSSIFNAVQNILDERLMLKDKDLTIVSVVSYTATWKLLCVLLTWPVFSNIPVSTKLCSAGVLEDNIVAFNEVKTNKKLGKLLISIYGIGLCTAIVALFIVKYENATLKSILGLSRVFTIWIFFMVYKGFGHSDFYVLDLIGMLLLAAGTLWYVYLDSKDYKQP